MPVLDLISNLRKSPPRPVPELTHLVLNGINQKVFLNQWGEPETQIGLNQLGKLDRLGTLFLITVPAEQTNLSVWIYEKKDSILFFTKEKLVSHFSYKKLKHWIAPSGSHSK